MNVPFRRLVFTVQAGAALVGLLGLASCSSHPADSLAGPGADSRMPFDKGPGNQPPPPPPPPVVVPPVVSANPCASLTGLTATVTATSAAVVQFRANRLRMEVTGDVARGTVNTLGLCSSNLAPAVTFVSGSATVSRGVARVLTFGALPSGAAIGEPGVIVGSDAAGNVLEIIWPALSGAGPGAPIFRLQLANVSGFAAGNTVTASMKFVARAPDGTTATFTANGVNMVVPALK